MNRCLHKDPYKLSNFATSLSTAHHSLVQPHDVQLDVQPDVPVHVNHALLPSVQSVTQLDQVHVQDDQSALVLQDAGHVDDAQSTPVQTPNILPAQVQVYDLQSASDKLADDDVVKQKPPDPPDNNVVLRRSQRSCKRRFACLNVDNL